MENLATAVRALGQRKSALETELAKVNQELKAISAALAAAAGEQPASQPSTPATKVAAPPPETAPKTAKKAPATKAPATKKAPASAKSAAKKAVQRSWFKPGEAQGLFEKLLKNPMSRPQLVSEIVVLKGNQKLPKPDLERFKWATAAALKAAVRAKKLVKSGGKLALAAGRKPAPAKVKQASR